MTIEEYYVSFIQDLLADSGDDFVLNTFISRLAGRSRGGWSIVRNQTPG